MPFSRIITGFSFILCIRTRDITLIFIFTYPNAILEDDVCFCIRCSRDITPFTCYSVFFLTISAIAPDKRGPIPKKCIQMLGGMPLVLGSAAFSPSFRFQECELFTRAIFRCVCSFSMPASFEHVSQFNRGRIVEYRDCILFFREISHRDGCCQRLVDRSDCNHLAVPLHGKTGILCDSTSLTIQWT